MSVDLRLHRGKYIAVWYESGKRIRRSLGTHDENEARRRLAHLKLTENIVDRQTQKTVEEIFWKYVAAKKLENKPTTRIEFGWKSLKPTFGHLYPQYITDEIVASYRDNRKAARGTIHVELNYLRTVMNWGFHKKYISSPVSISLPSRPPPKSDYLTKEQFHTVLKGTTYPHLILFMILAVTTGARSNALLDLTWDRVDFNKRIIDLRNPEKHESAKGRAIVPINDTALRYLLTAKKGAQTRYVIEFAKLPIKHIRYAMERISERAGLKVTAHMFRHSAAVWMAEGSVPMSEIAQFLGHSNTQITERIYARYSPNYLRNAAKHLEI